MKQIVYKYRLDDLVNKHTLPRDAVPVLVGQQNVMTPSVWMKHRAEFTPEDCGEFTFFVNPTGSPFEHEHIGSFIASDGFHVWHVTMERPQPPIEILTKVEEPWFENHYDCPECGTHWIDEWSCASNDACPECDTQDISPYESKELK